MKKPATKKLALTLLLLLSLLPAARTFAAEKGKVTKSYVFTFGPGYFSNLNTRAIATVLGGGVVWSIDPQFDLLLMADLGISFKYNDVRYFSPQIKGRYMFDEEAPHSLFAGGGIGLSYAVNHDTFGMPPDSVIGFSVGASIGYKFYRKSSMPIILEFEHQMILQESRYGTPLMTWLKVGAFFP
jgi:hypothetical protein